MQGFYDSLMIRLDARSRRWAKTLRRIALIAAVAGYAPAALASDGELHTFHCLFGCPLGAPATNDTVVREIYTLSSNDLGSGLVDQSQKMTVAARAMADKKTVGHLS